MSEHLEAAAESLRQSDLAVDAAAHHGKLGDTQKAIEAIADVMGHTRHAVGHLANAVNALEKAER